MNLSMNIETIEMNEKIKNDNLERIKKYHKIVMDNDIKKFFIWMVREAKIEVLDAEDAITVFSLSNDEVGLAPILKLDEFIKLYRKQKGY